MQLQMSLIYLRTVGWKLRGKTRRNGTAIAYALRAVDFRRCTAPKLLFSPKITLLLTYGTLVAETFVGIGVWISELRYVAIIVGFAFHLGIETFLNVHLFGVAMCVGLLVFLPPHDVAAWFSSWRERFVTVCN